MSSATSTGMNRKPILIYGAGGLGREILSLIRQLPSWEPVGFIDDHIKTGSVDGIPVRGGAEFILRSKERYSLVLGLGNPQSKATLSQRLAGEEIDFPVLIHPSAIIQDHDRVQLGEGTVIGAGCIFTTCINIGRHVLVNIGSTIGHDCSIGDYSCIMPGVNIAGNVKIGECVLVGSGSNIRNQIEIGKSSIVGMGSVIVKNVSENLTVAGVPARPIVK